MKRLVTLAIHNHMLPLHLVSLSPSVSLWLSSPTSHPSPVTLAASHARRCPPIVSDISTYALFAWLPQVDNAGFGNCSHVMDDRVDADHRTNRASMMEQVLSTSEMAQYVICNFECDRRGVAFPPSPLLDDFLALCPRYDLAMAEEAAQSSNSCNCPNEAERLGVLHGRTLHRMGSALTKLRWSTFESWVWLNGDRILEARFREEAEQEDKCSDVEGAASCLDDGKQKSELGSPPSGIALPPLHGTREMVNFVRESFRWCWRSSTHPPCPLSNDYRDLCLHFTLPDVERTVLDFELPEMVQVIFYAMLLNDAIKLGVVSSPMVADLKLTLEGLRWSPFESWLGSSSRGLVKAQLRQWTPERKRTEVIEGGEERMASFPTFLDTMHVAEYVRDNFHRPLRESSVLCPKLLHLNFHGLCPNFDFLVAMQFAHATHIPKMVQAFFYAMVINEAMELKLSSRATMDFMTSNLRPSRSSSSEGALTSSSPRDGPATLDKSILKKRDCAPMEPIPEIVAMGLEFSRASACSDPQDGPDSHFPNPKVIPTLKRTALEMQYLLLAGIPL
ncbi:hypothetical protein Cgig2_006615 [Carnegiea gigantea]|uniref:Uncharacterized protein n=1 Tax=Carnegiea gigantea TaxID=171969 RepID=A0A9Q1KQR5_9CARY|nr:hypothetical protein Cgig2_006615 [Carnegiea gigantea]